jgi:hypothetical protein
MEKIKELINQKVDRKIKDLATWRNVRYQNDSRLFVETENLEIELSEFEPDIKIYFLNRLKEQIEQREITIQGNLPGSAPDITKQFIDWIETVLIDLKIKSYSYQNTKPQQQETGEDPQQQKIIHRARGIALVLAFKAGKIPEDIWYSNKLKKYAEKKFNIKNGHWPNREAKTWINLLEKVQKEHPEDYQNGEKLYKTIF